MDCFSGKAHLFTDSNQTLDFVISLMKQFGFLFALEVYPHLIIVDLAEFVQVHRGDDALVLIHIALGMQILTKARSYKFQ